MFVTILKTLNYKGRYTLGDMSLQHFAATNLSMCTGCAVSCCNTLRDHFAVTNRFVCIGESGEFFANSIWLDFVRLVAATNCRCRDKDLCKILLYTRSDLSLRLVAATCCSNLSHGGHIGRLKVHPRNYFCIYHSTEL